MISPVLAIVDLGESSTGPKLDFWEYGGIALGITMVLFAAFALVLSSIWLIRTVRRLSRTSQTAFQPTDDPMQQITDARAHLDASKRHIAALDQKLDQLEGQLKRRPLS